MPVTINGNGVVTGLDSEGSSDLGSELEAAGGLVMVAPTTIASSGGTATLTAGAVSFSGVSSVSLNGVFSASYDNYYILVTRTAGSSTTMRMRAAGTDNSASSYELRGYYYGASNANENITNGTSWNISNGSGLAMASIVLVNPFLASNTFGVEQLLTPNLGETASIVHTVATSYDGFSINGTSQTGTIRVYGYRNGI
jgi:hypothetical protein